MALELAAHCRVALSSRRLCDLVSCHTDCFRMSLPGVHFSGSSLPLSMVVGFPGPLPRATVMPGQLLQHVLRLLLLLPRLSLELHVSSCSWPYTVRVLCPVIPHSDSWPHTSLSLSACLLRHLRILKGELVFKKVFFHFKNRELYCNDGS